EPMSLRPQQGQTDKPSQQDEPWDEVLAAVVSILSQRAAVAHAALNSATRLLDLGLDSLAWMEVVASLEEQLGVQLQETDLAKLNSIGDLVSSLQESQIATTEPRGLERGDYDF